MKTYLFDFDGTLVDTLMANFFAYLFMNRLLFASS